jgi:hypothetical protein
VAPNFGISLSQPVVSDNAAGLADAIARPPGQPPDAVTCRWSAAPFEASRRRSPRPASRSWGPTVVRDRALPHRGTFRAPGSRHRTRSASRLSRSRSRSGSRSRRASWPGFAFDAVEMARLLGRIGQQDRDGLLREGGFDGVLALPLSSLGSVRERAGGASMWRKVRRH